MSYTYSNGIGYFSKSQAAIYSEPSKISAPKDADTFASSTEWSPWGCNNDEPDQIACDIENCGVLSAGIESEARLCIGRSLDPYLLVNKKPDGTEELEWISDSEILDWMEANEHYQQSYRNFYNKIGYGWSATQFLLNAKRDKINRIRTTDIHSARLQRRDDKSGLIKNLFLSYDWKNVSGSSDKIKKVPLLEEGWELEHLQATKSGYEFAILDRILKNGRAYYPTPLHRSAKAWVAITRSVPNIKMAMNKNQMLIKYLVIIADTYWERVFKEWNSFTQEQRNEKVKDVHESINNWLIGELNAGKSIIAGKCYDPKSQQFVDDINITVIDDKMKDGKMLPDSAAADKQILFSMFANPAIFGGNLLGDGASGGAGSGSDIREATLTLLEHLHPERNSNLRIYNLVKNYNGWAKRLEAERTIFPVTNIESENKTQKKIIPRLVFRYSSAILTTLDQGKSTKPVTN